MAAELFPCFGISAFGMCAYNPAQPSPIYFNVGNAVGVLAFTFAAQQLLKPIYRFRLRAYGLKIFYLLGAIFAGAFCTLIAMVVPNIGVSHSGMLGYPISWELLGGFLISVTYGLVAFISLTPARIYSWNLLSFVRAGGALLSGATEDDRSSFAEDILNKSNMESLIYHSYGLDRAERHGAVVEMERLRSIGAPQIIRGRAPVSAFYLFTHRRALEKATFAATFLRIISDHELCSVMIRRHPWRVAAMLQRISRQQIHAEAAHRFIQQIATQSIIQEGSLITKEIIGGFSQVAILSQSLFQDYFVLRNYNPLSGLQFEMSDSVTNGFCDRLNSASKMMLETAIEHKDFWPQGYMHHAESVYERVCRRILHRTNGREIDTAISLQFGITALIRTLNEALESLDWRIASGLFVRDADPRKHRGDLVDIVASIIFVSFEEISNGFKGFDDEAWTHAISIFTEIYPFYESEPEGMNPLQQQLALKLLGKVKQNMDGWYPAITRVLLAVVGPYKKQGQKDGSALVLLTDAFYKELQKLPKLHANKPEKVPHFLPENITYDPDQNTLTHTFRFGESVVTKLSELNLPEVDLCKEQAWRKPAGQPTV
jgi:hypothetical protein